MKRRSADLRPFFRPFEKNWRPMALGSLLGLSAVLAAVGLLSLSGWFITAAALAGATAAGAAAFNFFFPSIGVRVFAVARTLARYAERVISHDATFRILSDLRTAFYKRLEPRAPAGLMRRRSGDLLQRLVADIDTLDYIYLRLVSPCAVAVFAAAAVLIYLAFFDAAAAVFAAAALLLTGAVVALAFGRLGGRAGQRMTASSARLRARIVEGMQGMAELLVFGAVPAVKERIGQDQQALLGAQRQMNRLTGAANALVVLVSGLAALGVLWIVAAGAADRRISPAVLVLMVFAVVGAFESVFPLAAAFPFLGRTRAAARRLQQLASPAPTIRFPDAGPARLSGRDLCFERVAFRYAAQNPPVFDGLDLVLARGGKMALMGPTGAGKSTLVHLMCRFWDPDSGRILIGGTDIRKLTEERLRSAVSVVSQRAHLFSATIRDNLLLARPGAADERLWEALSAVELDGFVRNLPKGLDTWIGAGGRGVSGGQARRLVIARAVLHDAPIWVLDEPTEGLDVSTERALFEMFFSLAAERTLLVITHRPVMLHRFDHVAVLENGAVAALGTAASLSAAGGRYAALTRRFL